jgi:hypothetical protein
VLAFELLWTEITERGMESRMSTRPSRFSLPSC